MKDLGNNDIRVTWHRNQFVKYDKPEFPISTTSKHVTEQGTRPEVLTSSFGVFSAVSAGQVPWVSYRSLQIANRQDLCDTELSTLSNG